LVGFAFGVGGSGGGRRFAHAQIQALSSVAGKEGRKKETLFCKSVLCCLQVLPSKAQLRMFKPLLEECGTLELSYLSPERWQQGNKSGSLLVKVREQTCFFFFWEYLLTLMVKGGRKQVEQALLSHQGSPGVLVRRKARVRVCGRDGPSVSGALQQNCACTGC
jgi:hypothetical protein